MLLAKLLLPFLLYLVLHLLLLPSFLSTEELWPFLEISHNRAVSLIAKQELRGKAPYRMYVLLSELFKSEATEREITKVERSQNVCIF